MEQEAAIGYDLTREVYSLFKRRGYFLVRYSYFILLIMHFLIRYPAVL